ncbi:dna replication licensing factor mcm3 [Plasmopara halstedii]|uniref:DNA helicase n=1 Tax=Plasmopara halstedii TaxID=4781 RepID=A0A0P1AQX3_PLAHL|nr:dna replication licensing factor mcm3 [Plasmopara halstedii]CEG43992.1 dna replication licensing factor mcm3 [Plasmopara halstedii]|eukprot:XP_024580361.1 dna replication licensing factor mcm3 [Plasmopara halstedii]
MDTDDLIDSTLIPDENDTLLVLNVSDNQLIHLSESIGNLELLRELLVANNRITTLPIQLARCVNLRKLDFRCNRLTVIPRRLQNLRVLNVGYNKLTQLPYTLCDCSSLEQVDCEGNEDLKDIPDGLRNNTKLMLWICSTVKRHHMEISELIEINENLERMARLCDEERFQLCERIADLQSKKDALENERPRNYLLVKKHVMRVTSEQDALDEAYRRHKQYFQDFLEDEGGYGNYSEKLHSMMHQKSSRLVVDLNDLREYDSSFTDPAVGSQDNIVSRILRRPAEFIPPFEEAIKERVFNIDSLYGSKEAESTKDMQFYVGFEGDFGHHNVNPRGLLASYLTQMVCVHGIVTKCSAVRPKVVRSVHYCKETNAILSREYRDNTSITGAPTSSVYPTKDESGNLLETEFGLSQYKDYQMISMQETPETAPLGQLPRSCEVIVENDIVDKCKPGDRIRVIGIYRPLGGNSTAASTAVFRTVLIANNIQLMGKEVNGIVMSSGDLVNVREFAKRKDAFEMLSRSIAPSIYGHAEIKQALLLQLLGGVEKNLENGTHLRGDVNILMVGDPSTAKSQLLRFVRTIAPLAVNTTGRGSSGVGLTAAVTTDPDTKERRLEAGAMVLADRGIVCIDEFDKMSEADRVAIHEVMEQQTVTIAKAGIHATLNARCSVLAAANPVYGQYNKNRKPQENIGLPDSLLSRFDLLFVVLDRLDRDADRNISDHVLRMHRYTCPGQEGVPLSFEVSSTDHLALLSEVSGDESKKSIFQKFDPLLHGGHQSSSSGGSGNGILTLDFLKKYIYYAKTRYQPVLTDSAIELISEGYAELRSHQNARTLPVTARSLETLIRLASAHAKARLSKTIEVVDAEKAISLISFALYHDASEPLSKNAPSRPEETPEVERSSTLKSMAELEIGTSVTPDRPVDMSKKRDRGSWSTAVLADDVLSVLSELGTDMNEDEENDSIKLTDILSRLNVGRSKGDTVPLAELEKVLVDLEEQNKVMYIQDGGDPMVMLI